MASHNSRNTIGARDIFTHLDYELELRAGQR